jgi:hypothetical protein
LSYYNELLDRSTYFVNKNRIKTYFKTFQFKKKSEDITGLQIADIVAYPITRYVLDRNEVNLAFDIVEKKLYRQKGRVHGLKIHPAEEGYKKRVALQPFSDRGVPYPIILNCKQSNIQFYNTEILYYFYY